MSSIRDIAKDADVSIATVSRVLNNNGNVGAEARERVLNSVNRVGYVPSVGRRATAFIALAYTGPMTLGSPYDAALFEGMADAMNESDHDLVVLSLQRDKKPEETYTQYFLRKGVRGAILRTTNRTRQTCKAIAAERFPSIVVADRFKHASINYIDGDSRPSSYNAVEHLLALGHKRIAIAVNEVEDADHIDRLDAYQQALIDNDIQPDPKLVYRIPASRPDGAQIIRAMMSSLEPPTAIYITDPIVAVSAINQSHQMGIRIPEDLSILGFDDSDTRHNVYPKMTAVCQDARQLGYEAFDAVSELLQDMSSIKSIRRSIQTWLEIHQTTGSPPEESVRILPDGTRVRENSGN